jgi:hypothetical protein
MGGPERVDPFLLLVVSTALSRKRERRGPSVAWEVRVFFFSGPDEKKKTLTQTLSRESGRGL